MIGNDVDEKGTGGAGLYCTLVSGESARRYMNKTYFHRVEVQSFHINLVGLTLEISVPPVYDRMKYYRFVVFFIKFL